MSSYTWRMAAGPVCFNLPPITLHGGGTGIAGPPDYCIERIRAIQRLGFDRIVIPGQLMGGDRSREVARRLLVEEVMPNIR